MLIPSDLDARDVGLATPPSCHPFTVYSNVCIGDMIAIIACSIAGIGFIFWGIHAIRKMRQFPFTYPENKGELNRGNDYVPSAIDDSILVQNGVARTPSLPERVRTRLALSEPEEDFYRHPAPISTDPYHMQGSMTTMPRAPPRAGGRSQRSSSRRSSRHISLSRAPYEYEVNAEYMRNAKPSRVKGSPVRKLGGDYRHRQYGVNDDLAGSVALSRPRGPSVRKSSGDYRLHESTAAGVPYAY